MELFGYIIPFWVIILGILVIALVLWGVLKFAVKIIIIIAVILIALIGLDVLVGLFSRIGL
jgi:hypothetical protein